MQPASLGSGMIFLLALKGTHAFLPGLETLSPVQFHPVLQGRLYCIAAAVVALTYPVCGSLLCLGVKEQPGMGVQ